MQLPFAVFPLVLFISDRRKMGGFVIPRSVAALAWVVAGDHRRAQRQAAVRYDDRARLIPPDRRHWSGVAGSVSPVSSIQAFNSV